MMLHIPGVLTAEPVKAICDRVAATDWIDARASVGGQGAQVKRKRQLAQGSPLALELGQTGSAASMANPSFLAGALPLRILPPFFNSDAGGEHHGAHVDGAIRAQRNGPALRTDVSCTVFLSDPGEYEGGESSVIDAYGAHEAQLPAGRCCTSWMGLSRPCGRNTGTGRSWSGSPGIITTCCANGRTPERTLHQFFIGERIEALEQ